MQNFSLRRFLWAQVAFVTVIVVGTVGFHLILGEDWMSSLYRSVVTITLTGLDTKPEGAAARLFTLAPAARRRGTLPVRRRGHRGADRRRRPDRKMGRAETEAGHRAAARSLHHLRLRPRRPASRLGVAPGRARLRGGRLQRGSARRGTRAERPRRRGKRHARRGSRRCRHRAGGGARRLVGLGRRQPLHHDHGANAQARTCSSSRVRPTSTPPRSSGARGPTASCSPIPLRARSWRTSCSSRRSRRSWSWCRRAAAPDFRFEEIFVADGLGGRRARDP